MKYDAIVTLGNGLDEHWQVPGNVQKRLKVTVSLYQKHNIPKIVVCGKWSINWDLNGITPPTTEAEEMKKYIMSLGVPEKDIIKEEESKDTIGNIYYLKTRIAKQLKFKHILLVCADFHLKRVKYLFNKIVANKFITNFETVSTESFNDVEFMQIQDDILNGQSAFLKDMKAGDDSYLEKRLYDDPYYHVKRPQKGALIGMKGAK